jgi:F0F1-type ATP synthase delta subunit
MVNNFIIGGIKVVIDEKVWDHTIIKKIKTMTENIKTKELL